MWECITVIEAQEQLKEFTAQDWPNMKKAEREKRHRNLHRQAYPFQKAKTVTPQQLAKLLAGL